MKKNGKELRDDIKSEMWETALGFLKGLSCENIADLCWRYNKDGAVEKIEVTFEEPLYLTSEPPDKSKPRENK